MIDWFARNTVAANLLMAFIVVGGLLAAFTVISEAMPEISLDRVLVEVPYRGAAPEEVEEAVCVRIEEAIYGLDGIKQIVSTASENVGTVMIELELGADMRRVLDDVKGRVDAIDTFPEETEKPIIRELVARQQVTDLAVSGYADEFVLKAVAERVRNELSALPEISQVELMSARPYEISIEVSEAALRRHGLTFDDVAGAVRRSSLDLPGGSVRAASPARSSCARSGRPTAATNTRTSCCSRGPTAPACCLGEVATVVDGFAETDQFGAASTPTPTLLRLGVPDGRPGARSRSRGCVHGVRGARAPDPAGGHLAHGLAGRQATVLNAQPDDLMFRNGLTAASRWCSCVLALFLELRLAFWVSLGHSHLVPRRDHADAGRST